MNSEIRYCTNLNLSYPLAQFLDQTNLFILCSWHSFHSQTQRNMNWLKSKRLDARLIHCNNLSTDSFSLHSSPVRQQLYRKTNTAETHLIFKCFPSSMMTNTIAEWREVKIPPSFRMCRLSCMLNFQPHVCDCCPFFHFSHWQCTILLIL